LARRTGAGPLIAWPARSRSRAASLRVGRIGSSSPRSIRFSAERARLTRLFTVPTSQPMTWATSS